MVGNKNSYRMISAPEVRAINRSSILELIRCDGPISRSQIADVLQVSLPTVMRIVDVLTAEGWVYETGEKEWSGGRKRALLNFSGSDRVVIGIDLGGTKIFGALSDLNGCILYETIINHHQTQAEESLNIVFRMIDLILKEAIQKGMPVSGIGIGVPGIVIPETGVISLAPALGWQGFPLQEYLMEWYPYPIVIENDVNLAALGEVWFGQEECNEKNLVLIAIGTGIGAGIVINGNIYSGTHHMAGEIGYLLLDRSHLGQKYPEFGAFEQVASGMGIAERAHKMIGEQTKLESISPMTAEEVFNAARRNEIWAQTILVDTIDYLAQAVAAVSLLYDPEVVVLGGGVSKSADLLIGPILKRLDGAIPALPKMHVSQPGYRGVVLGATMELLRITTNQKT